MKINHEINQIIEKYTPAISSGEETVDTILEKYPQYNHELRSRLEAVQWLIKAKQNLEPRKGFITSSRKYVEQSFASYQPHNTWQRLSRQYTPQRWIFNLAAPVLLLLLFALIINSLVLTARLSIPGDPFYSTKIFMEDIRLAFTFNQVHKTDLYIQFSRQRAAEFVELVLDGNYEVLPTAAAQMETEIIASLHSINKLTNNHHYQELPKTGELRETLSSEILMLNILKNTSPPSAYSGIELAIQVAQSGLMALR